MQFVFDDFFEATGSEFTRENVVGIFEKIMIGYAMGELRCYLQTAAKVIENKCFEYAKNHGAILERSAADYLHGMIDPQNPQRTLPSRFASHLAYPSELVHRRLGQLELKPQGLESTEIEDALGSSSPRVEPIVGQVVVPRKRQLTE